MNLRIFLFPLFCLILLLSACTSAVVVDNPSQQKLLVSIDDTSFELDALASKTLKLKHKKSLLVVKDSSGVEIVNQEVAISKNGILNPSKAEYVIQKDIYCATADFEKYKDKLNLKDTVKVNGKEYENVDFTITDALFIPKKWDLGLAEDFPTELQASDYKIVTKVYRVAALEKQFGYIGTLDLSNYSQEDVVLLLDSLANVLKDKK